MTSGHFYLYDTLPLTEFSRAFDHEYALASDSADRTLTRMALALPYVLRDRRKFFLFIFCIYIECLR